MMYTLSPASLNVFKDCPRCFWRYQNKGVRNPSPKFNPSLPSGMDRVIKQYFDSYREKKRVPPELASLKGVKLFQDKDLLEKWRSNGKDEGIRWTNEEGDTLMGIVDDVLTKKDKLIVLDFKTKGFSLGKDSHKRYQHQLDIYTFLLQQNGYGIDDVAYLLFYRPKQVTENGVVLFYNDLVEVKVSVDNAKNLFETALETLESKIPEASEKCGFCNNAKSKKKGK